MSADGHQLRSYPPPVTSRPPPPLLRSALAAHARGELGEAVRLYRATLATEGGHFSAWHNLGHALVQQGESAEAVRCFERALRLDPTAAQSHNMLAAALRGLGRYDEAVAHHRQAIALRPDYAQAHHDLGRLELGLGHIDAAATELEAAIALAPTRGGYYRSLSEAVRFTEGDARLAAMEVLARRTADLSPVDRLELQFALGKAYADVNRHAESFAAFSEGCGLMRRFVDYDEAATLAMFDRMRAVFTADLMRDKAGAGCSSAAPIFILGMPRTGSTLVEQILAGHPEIAGGGELSAFRDVAAAALGDPGNVNGMNGRALEALGDAYLSRTRQVRGKAARFTDKMPANFLLVGLIHLALPNARIIHTVRDPIDTCLSCFTTLFAEGQQYSYDLGELGRHYRGYARLMDHWRQVLPPGVMLEVRYEEVVADLKGQARRMVDHCGVAWSDACLEFPSAQRAVWTASAAQVRRPAYRTSVARPWPEQRLLRPLIEGLAGVG